MPRLELHPAASAELVAAFDWYEAQSSGLGDEFLSGVEEGISAIVEAPVRRPRFVRSVRRYLMRRFPYAIVYRQKAG